MDLIDPPLDVEDEHLSKIWFMQPKQAMAYLRAPSLRLVHFVHEPLPYSPRNASLSRAKGNWRKLALGKYQNHNKNSLRKKE